MADPVTSYPFDPTGQAITNKIVNEPIVLPLPGDRLFHFTMPKFAPMFEDGLDVKVRDYNNNVIPLVKGVDYYLGHKFADASLATMHPIWGSIVFLRRDIAGVILVSYQTLGGIWTIDSNKMGEILMNTALNPRTTTWELVVSRPVDFPVIDHPWNLLDMVGAKELVEAIEKAINAYLAVHGGEGGGSGELARHLSDYENPHRLTAAKLGTLTTAEINALVATRLEKNATAANSTKFAGYTATEFRAFVLLGRAADSDKLEGKTLAQVIQLALQGTAANSNKLGGKTLQEIINDLGGAGGGSAATTLDGKTLEQIMDDVAETTVKKAKDSERFDGKTWEEAVQSISQEIVPAKAKDSEKVYGYDITQLGDAIARNEGFIKASPFSGYVIQTDTVVAADGDLLWYPIATVNHPAETNPGVYPNLQESMMDISISRGNRVDTSRIIIGFDNLIRQPIIKVVGYDNSDEELKFGFTEELLNGELSTTFYLRVRFSASRVNVNQFVKGSVVITPNGGWTFDQPDAIEYGEYDDGRGIMETQETLNDLADEIDSLLTTPATAPF